MMWKAIPNWARYQASDAGDIRCALSGIVLRPRVMKQGTRRCVLLLADDGEYRMRAIGRLVCMAFHGLPPSPSHQAAHGDGNSLNDAASNLRWATPSENNQDRHLHGTMPCGDRAVNRLLSSATATALRDEYRALRAAQRRDGKGKLPNGTIDRLAARYGVSKGTVRSVGRGETWKHL